VALIQSVLAALGFLVAGLPGAGLWAVVFLVAALLQVGTLVLIPAVIYVFATSSATKAVIFYGLVPLRRPGRQRHKATSVRSRSRSSHRSRISRCDWRVRRMGLIGLFVGAIVLSVGYSCSLPG